MPEEPGIAETVALTVEVAVVESSAPAPPRNVQIKLLLTGLIDLYHLNEPIR